LADADVRRLKAERERGCNYYKASYLVKDAQTERERGCNYSRSRQECLEEIFAEQPDIEIEEVNFDIRSAFNHSLFARPPTFA
jgi:hypothetical protein